MAGRFSRKKRTGGTSWLLGLVLMLLLVGAIVLGASWVLRAAKSVGQGVPRFNCIDQHFLLLSGRRKLPPRSNLFRRHRKSRRRIPRQNKRRRSRQSRSPSLRA